MTEPAAVRSIRRTARRSFTACALLASMSAVTACAGFRPQALSEVQFRDRAVTESRDDLRVTVAVPSAEETRALFDAKLYKKKIQPVWIEVENRGDDTVWIFPIAIDRDYFPPLEAAWKSHRTCAKKTNRRIDAYFARMSMPWDVPAGSTASGFVFVNRDPGTKHVPVDVLRNDGLHAFDFVVPVPGLRADHTSVDFYGLYAPDEFVDLASEDALRRWVAELPCCTSNAKDTRTGDPLNFVLIARDEEFGSAFVRAGWDETAAMTGGSMIKTAGAAMFGKTYRTAPISPLYAFGRPQDIGLQKGRSNVHQRNHLRLWLAPATYLGDLMWVGQISRDIGSRLTTKSPTLTTHKIDPDVDEARDFLVLDLAYSGALAAIGYVAGVGPSTPEEPGNNLTGDPFWTDGRRAVLFLSADTVAFEDVRYFFWDEPDR